MSNHTLFFTKGFSDNLKIVFSASDLVSSNRKFIILYKGKYVLYFDNFSGFLLFCHVHYIASLYPLQQCLVSYLEPIGVKPDVPGLCVNSNLKHIFSCRNKIMIHCNSVIIIPSIPKARGRGQKLLSPKKEVFFWKGKNAWNFLKILALKTSICIHQYLDGSPQGRHT